ncbi:MAG: hypothetical protein MK085_09930 [Phycisphaerales bacterium]|nr:hypothetical protein [Phycisphaerales bacterium]
MTASSPPPPGIPILEPDTGPWSDQVRRHAANHGLPALRKATRKALDLPIDQPLLATGHQAMAWHPGILAKDVAIAACGDMGNLPNPLATVHFIADHDANDGGLVAYPTLVDGEVRRVGWRALPPAHGQAARDRPAVRPTSPPQQSALASVTEGLAQLHAALASRADAPSIADQLGGAMAELAEPFTGPIPRRSMSDLLKAPIGIHLLERMATDPMACATACNVALQETLQEHHARRPAARPLSVEPVPELPLWRVTPDGRRTVRADELLDPETLRPKALLATALVRLAGCDGFVHGLGGARYDTAMERWITLWLGETWASALAPRFTASATLPLPLPHADHQVKAGHVDLRRQWHAPSTADDQPRPSAVKRGLLKTIASAPRGSDRREEAFQALHDWLRENRQRHGTELESMAEEVARNRSALKEAAVAGSRDWPFPLHDATTLQEDVVDPILQAFAAR